MELDTAAILALCGLPALRYLRTRDADERALLRAIAARADKLLLDLQIRQATSIANAFVKAKLHG